MELSEMVEMFNTNKIHCEQMDLQKLFFGDKYFPPDVDPGLDFYAFMGFAISKEGDQDFRNFMRKVKEKIRLKKIDEEASENSIDNNSSIMKGSLKSFNYKDKPSKHSLKSIKSDNSEKKDGESEKSEDKEAIYLPMNFNKVLDYFNDKVKESNCVKGVDEAIEKITDFIKTYDKFYEKEKEKKVAWATKKEAVDKSGEPEKESNEHEEIVLTEVLEIFRDLFNFNKQQQQHNTGWNPAAVKMGENKNDKDK